MTDKEELRDSDDPAALAEMLSMLEADSLLAHEYLFSHRHPDATPDFHREMILDWHSPAPYVLDEAFRGGAKSTVAEEAITTLALFGKFRNAVILGENETRAVERLSAVKNELENNDKIHALWGPQVGPIWGERRIELLNGTYLQALGRDQSMRGVKHKDMRPDMLFVDDYEDEECVATPDARQKVWRRFWSVVIPAMDKNHRARVAGTPLDVEAFIVRLRKMRGWISKRFPIEYVDESGERRAMWASRFPLAKIDEMKAMMLDAGESEVWQREFMLDPVDELTKPFKRSDFKTQVLTRTWEPCYAIYDPARTTKQATSAHTGIITMSWLRQRMISWESRGAFMKPDEIVADMFETNERYRPVAIGVEVNGLEEFLLQPIRTEQVRRGIYLPIRALRAPRNKIDFIKGLQPYVKAGEFILNGEQAELLNQFDMFPRGRIDIPNAAAYIVKVRTGVPVYPVIDHYHYVPDLKIIPQRPLFLCLNAMTGFATAVLAQFTHTGTLNILGDWVHDGAIGDMLSQALRDVSTEFAPGKEQKPKIVAPLYHWSNYNQLGLIAAVKAIPAELTKGGDVIGGREEMRRLIGQSGTRPGLQVSQRALWFLNGVADGFAYELEKQGHPSAEPMENIYRTIVEGVECLTGLSRAFERTGDNQRRIEHTSDGRAFTSARATPR